MKSIKQALSDLKAGKLIILTDDRSRENEGDLVLAADKVTPQAINFMITRGRGLVCLAMTPALAKKLKLKPIVKKNTARFHTNFAEPIDSAQGATTGISAIDRYLAIKTAVKKNAKPSDLARPGHVHTLIANPKGIIARPGHTEASVELCHLAGLTPAGILCEILDKNGNSARGKTLSAFAKKHKLTMISIKELINLVKN